MVATRSAIGTEPGAYELTVYTVDKKAPDQVTGVDFVVHADTRDPKAPVKVRRGDATTLAPVKGKAMAVADASTLTVTVPTKAKLSLPKRFAWSVSAVNDDPNTATRFEDRCPSKPAPPAVPANVLVPATPTSQAAADQAFATSQLDADKARILAYWSARNDAWKAGIDAAAQATVDQNYPPFREVNSVNFEACRAFLDGTATVVQFTVDPASIRPQPGWAEPGAGQVPAGRIYVMTVTASNGIVSQPREVHITVDDNGTAFGFQSCAN